MKKLNEEDKVGSLHGGFFFFLNIRSPRSNHEHLVCLFKKFQVKPPVIALCEKWLSENDPLEIYKIDGYHPVVVQNRSKRKVGNAILT